MGEYNIAAIRDLHKGKPLKFLKWVTEIGERRTLDSSNKRENYFQKHLEQLEVLGRGDLTWSTRYYLDESLHSSIQAQLEERWRFKEKILYLDLLLERADSLEPEKVKKANELFNEAIAEASLKAYEANVKVCENHFPAQQRALENFRGELGLTEELEDEIISKHGHNWVQLSSGPLKNIKENINKSERELDFLNKARYGSENPDDALYYSIIAQSEGHYILRKIVPYLELLFDEGIEFYFGRVKDLWSMSGHSWKSEKKKKAYGRFDEIILEPCMKAYEANVRTCEEYSSENQKAIKDYRDESGLTDDLENKIISEYGDCKIQ